MTVNWHRIFHGFTADWRWVNSSYTNWEYMGQIHGPHGGEPEYKWVRAQVRCCSWCGKEQTWYRIGPFTNYTNSSGKKPREDFLCR